MTRILPVGATVRKPSGDHAGGKKSKEKKKVPIIALFVCVCFMAKVRQIAVLLYIHVRRLLDVLTPHCPSTEFIIPSHTMTSQAHTHTQRRRRWPTDCARTGRTPSLRFSHPLAIFGGDGRPPSVHSLPRSSDSLAPTLLLLLLMLR